MRWQSKLLPLMALLAACHSSGGPRDAGEAPDAALPIDRGPQPDPDDLAVAPPDLAPTPDLALPSASECVQSLMPSGAAAIAPDYDQFHPTVAGSCAGTHHQQMTGIEKVVFLGDSITVGTPPSLPNDIYSAKLYGDLVAKFGAIEVQVCAQWGATTVDLLTGMQQIGQCFPSGVEDKRTLIVMTVGGNNFQDWALAHLSAADAMPKADVAVDQLRAAITWLKDPAHFPNGSYVLFANAYEYTDGTGDLDSCLIAGTLGLSGNVLALWPAILYLEEQYMKVAVDTGTDMMFLYEHFCGHGYHDDDPSAPCYRGPGTERWFDISCLHPTPNGHTQIADLFFDLVAP